MCLKRPATFPIPSQPIPTDQVPLMIKPVRADRHQHVLNLSNPLPSHTGSRRGVYSTRTRAPTHPVPWQIRQCHSLQQEAQEEPLPVAQRRHRTEGDHRPRNCAPEVRVPLYFVGREDAWPDEVHHREHAEEKEGRQGSRKSVHRCANSHTHLFSPFQPSSGNSHTQSPLGPYAADALLVNCGYEPRDPDKHSEENLRRNHADVWTEAAARCGRAGDMSVCVHDDKIE